MKDPAFLFYPGDWLSGTMGMTFEEKGAYFELLIFQFNTGKFTKAQAKQVLSICSAYVFDKVLQKFDSDGTFFWKQRLSDEIERRKKFSESRKNNAKSKKKHITKDKAYAKHMETETINETENGIVNEYIKWTNQILDNNDAQFETMLFNERWIIDSKIFDHLVRDHLGLLHRYPNMRPKDQASFRYSLLKHIRENKDKTNGKKFNGKAEQSAATSEYLKQHYSAKTKQQ